MQMGTRCTLKEDEKVNVLHFEVLSLYCLVLKMEGYILYTFSIITLNKTNINEVERVYDIQAFWKTRFIVSFATQLICSRPVKIMAQNLFENQILDVHAKTYESR